MLFRSLGVACVALAAIAYFAYSNLGTDLLPEMDEGGFILDYVMPAGSSLESTGKVLDHVERILRATPEVDSTSRRKIEYQIGKIGRKTASQIMARDAQAASDARALSGLVFPEKHLQERLYSIVPFLAKFGLGLTGDIYANVDTGNPDQRLLVF